MSWKSCCDIKIDRNIMHNVSYSGFFYVKPHDTNRSDGPQTTTDYDTDVN